MTSGSTALGPEPEEEGKLDWPNFGRLTFAETSPHHSAELADVARLIHKEWG